jgi:hypothetical protein
MMNGIATGTGDVMDTFLNNGLNDRYVGGINLPI